jgi:hypothetical protein
MMHTEDDKPHTFCLNRRFSDWTATALLALAIFLLGNLNLILGRVAPQWDSVDFFAPEFSLVADHIKAGRLLLWDPWLAAGSPDFAEPELGTASPILLAFAFLSPSPQIGFVAYWLALWAFGGLGVLLLTKHLRCPPWGGLIATLGFVASGFYTGHAEHTSSICSISFLPWILWRFDAALQKKSYWFGVQAGALYGLSALSGYPEFTILTPGFLAFWGVGRCFWTAANTSSRQTLGSRLVLMSLLLSIVVITGLAIASPSYVAFLNDTHGYSDRVGPRARDESISSNLLPPQAFSTFASPFLYLLNLPPGGIWPITDVSMSSIYVGVAATVLSLFGWTKRSPWRWWLALVAFFFICCSLGKFLPVRGWLYDFVPPTRYFRNPALFRIYPILLICIVAALGARDVQSSDSSERLVGRLCLLSTFLACLAVLLFGLVIHSLTKPAPDLTFAVTHLFITWFGVAIASFLLVKRVISKSALIGVFVVLACADALATIYIVRPTLYTEATLPWWHEMNAEHSSSLDLTRHGLGRDLDDAPKFGNYPNSRNLVVKTPTLNGYVTLRNRFYEQFVADPVLRQMSLGPNRFWFSTEQNLVSPDDFSFEQFARRVRQLGQPILVLHSPEQMESLSSRIVPKNLHSDHEIGPPSPSSPASVSDLSYKPNELSFRYFAPSAGWLLVTDRWASGWDATVNGKPQAVLGGNFIFRAVKVSAGENSIRFHYRPREFVPLLLLSWSVLLAAIIWQLRRMVGWVLRRDRPLDATKTSHGLSPDLAAGDANRWPISNCFSSSRE